MKFESDQAFVFANAFEFIISVFAAVMMLTFALSKVEGWGDLFRRLRKTLQHEFQGGPYDLAMAFTGIFIGKIIRTEAAWEHLFFKDTLSVSRLFLGVFISSLGIFCLIRILAPSTRFNLYSIGAAVVAMAFALFSAVY
jgi:hypothetical protein